MNLVSESGRDTSAGAGQSPVALHPSTALLDVRGVSVICGCSPRHIYRLADAGKMPAPIRLGSLVRWHRSAIDEWLAGGCRPVRTVATKGAQH